MMNIWNGDERHKICVFCWIKMCQHRTGHLGPPGGPHTKLCSQQQKPCPAPHHSQGKRNCSQEKRGCFYLIEKKKKSYTIHTLEPRETRMNNALPWTTHLCSCLSHNTKTSLIWEAKQDRIPKHCQLKMSLNRGRMMLRTVYKSASHL